jgi:hypothetical protein
MFPGGLDNNERGMLHDLIGALVERLNTQRRLNEDLTRQLEAVTARLELLTLAHYGTA